MKARKSKCKPGYVDWTMFGWCLRLPNGSAARGQSGRFPKYFASAQAAWAWTMKQKLFIGGGAHAETTNWIRCEVA